MKKQRIRGIMSFAVSYLLMAIIPMAVCGIFFYPRARRQIIERTDAGSMQQVEQGMEEFDRQLQIINNIPNIIFQNEDINRLDIETEPWKNLVISQEIKKIIVNNGLIKEVFLYARNQQYFFSGYQGNFSQDKLLRYKGTLGFEYENWKIDSALEVLSSWPGTFLRPAEDVVLRGIKCENIITFISVVPSNNKFAYAAIMVMVDGDQLAGLLPDSQNAGGGYIVFDQNQQMVYCSEGVAESCLQQIYGYGAAQMVQMKSVRIGNNYLLNSVQSPSSEWSIIKATDLSPMLEEIVELEYSVGFVMLGLSVVLGFLGYYFTVLNFRPLEQIALQLRQAGNRKKGRIRNTYYDEIERAICILQDDNSRMAGNLRQTKPRLKKHLFSELLSDSFRKEKEEAFLSELQNAGFEIDKNYYRVIVVRLPSEEICDQILAEGLGETEEFVYMSGMANRNSIVFLTGNSKDVGKLFFNKWRDKYKQIKQMKAGGGDKVNSILRISASYAQACAALDYLITCDGKDVIVYYDDLPDSLFQVRSYPLELIESLAFAVRMNKAEDAGKIMYQIEYMIQMEEQPPYYIRALFFNVVSIFMEKRENKENMESAAFRIFSQQLSMVQMIEILNGLYQNFRESSDVCNSKENEWMAQVRLYIGEHYGESTLSLTEVAEHIGMSSTWFSTLFKEKSGCNFKEYVDLIRLEKAKELLESSEMKIEDVAEAVGYNSSYSFARFFKKHMGVSPKNYRNVKN